MASEEFKEAEKRQGREKVGAARHRASSDEPDACCYADRRAQNGKRRERAEGRRKGGKV